MPLKVQIPAPLNSARGSIHSFLGCHASCRNVTRAQKIEKQIPEAIELLVASGMDGVVGIQHVYNLCSYCKVSIADIDLLTDCIGIPLSLACDFLVPSGFETFPVPK